MGQNLAAAGRNNLRKYQREIEEILSSASPSLRSRQRALGKQRSTIWVFLSRAVALLTGICSRLSPGRIALSVFILLLLAWWFRTSLPGFVGPVAWVVVILIVVGYAWFFINSKPSYEKRWRGQLIQSPFEPWWKRFTRRNKRSQFVQIWIVEF